MTTRGAEFLIFVSKKQLSKIGNYSSLNTTHSARNLGFIVDKYLTFSVFPVTI